jgi:hypothetical protein
MVGADTAQHYFPDKIATFKAKLEQNRVRYIFLFSENEPVY